ncbi:hypothetical protein MPSEU_000871700 [Mayamaea pseudoterrestris]|nr:hypothetical protein MPSEU_000871700 [Mayamaea pseudoterrestris]
MDDEHKDETNALRSHDESCSRSHNDYSNSSDYDDDADDSDLWDSQSSANGGNSPNDDVVHSEVQQLSRRETRAIRAWRVFILLLITCVGVGVSVGFWVILSNEEHDRYMESYQTFARSIQDTTKFYVNNLHHATRDLAQTITVSSLVRNQTFPFVSVGLFETLARHSLQQSAMEALLYSPLVSDGQRAEWEQYSVAHQDWIAASQSQYMQVSSTGNGATGTLQSDSNVYTEAGSVPIAPYIWSATTTNGSATLRVPEPADSGPYLPTWMVSPLPTSGNFFVNANRFNAPMLHEQYYFTAGVAREGVFSHVPDLLHETTKASIDFDHYSHREIDGSVKADRASDKGLPHAMLIEPVFDTPNEKTANVVGYVEGVVLWNHYMTGLVPDGVNGICCVLQNSCGQSFTFTLTGSKPEYVGVGDLHESAYDGTAVYVPLYDYIYPNATQQLDGHCEYYMTIYSSAEFEEQATTNLPAVVTAAAAGLFALVLLVFVLYDCFVERRNSILLEAAEKSHNILSSLFPQNVRERLFAEQKEAEILAKQNDGQRARNLKGYIDGGMNGVVEEADDEMGYKGKPIADLFSESTVLFADIAGFTAWSSQREPAQVFTLLETLYRAFDEIATKRRVFKVETIGDCYVAVTGVPEPQKEHAVIMCRFARDMMVSTRSLVKRLETTLGPDTGDLDMRVGIHSGPVTAGVLRGERSRFQLFGDTMNTASRTESTGIKGKIQLSQETADHLIGSGKAHWIAQRSDKVVAKGKGEMTTYWLVFASSGGSSGPSHANSSEQDPQETKLEVEEETAPKTDAQQARVATEKTSRLVAWNADVLLRLLKQMVARRKLQKLPLQGNGTVDENVYLQDGNLIIDEVKEIITLPTYDTHGNADELDLDQVEIGNDVVEALFDYVSNIAALYRNNPFHNFEHASHVTMSVTKLLSRIVAPSDIEYNQASGKSLHDHTYGITNDLLTQFACVYSALIHDVDHSGVPNAQLVEEKSQLAQFYKSQSVAEQNSVDLSWNLLMEQRYSALRRTIYTNEAEFHRFRKLVVNSVMATDIVDKELKTLRNKRWEAAFSNIESVESIDDVRNRKATIVIEHLIQASDVSHTMQHWHIYRKWNERFFFECFRAWKEGRSAQDPSESWYKGEMGFYDFYIIPLARKLKDCGVFGVSSEEYLNYAQRNRKEWEARGEEVVQEMILKAKEMNF